MIFRKKPMLSLNLPQMLSCLFLVGSNWACTQVNQQTSSEAEPAPEWTHLSTTQGDLEPPNTGNQQTATLVTDLDKDGINDFMITERTQAPSVVWYRRSAEGWDRYVVEDEPLRIEAGSAHYDIDGDGDEDVIFGGDGQNNQVWWWENPYPDFDTAQAWNRHLIKDGGANKHHDQLLGDFDGDGKQELIFLLVQPHTLDRLRRAEAFVQLGAVADILQFRLQIGAALAGLGMRDLDCAPQPALMLDDIAGANGIAVDLHV